MFQLFATIVVTTGVVDTSDNLPPVSLSPHAVHIVDPGGKFATAINDTSVTAAKFVAGVLIQVVHLDLQISPRFYGKS